MKLLGFRRTSFIIFSLEGLIEILKLFVPQTTNLTHAEAFVSLTDCYDQCTLKLLVAFVVGQAELIEACVGGWQAICKSWRRCYLKLWIEFLLKKVYEPWVNAFLKSARGKLTWKPPWGSCEQPVVNCRSRAISVCEKLLTAAQNQSAKRTTSWIQKVTTDIRTSHPKLCGIPDFLRSRCD